MIISIIILLLKQLDQILESRKSMCKQRVARPPPPPRAEIVHCSFEVPTTTAVNKEDDDSPHTPSCLHLQQHQQISSVYPL